jgi:hypothetical protein
MDIARIFPTPSGGVAFPIAALAVLGALACVAALLLLAFFLVRAIRRLGRDEFSGLYGTYYGYRAPLNPDPLLPLPLGVQLDILRNPWGGRPRAVWQNPSLEAGVYATGHAYRSEEGLTVLLDVGTSLPFAIALLDLAPVGIPDVKVGVQAGMLHALKYPYAACVLFSRHPLDQQHAAEALKRFGAFRIKPDEARAIAERALKGTR